MNPELSPFQHVGYCENGKNVEMSDCANQGTETAVSQEQTLDAEMQCVCLYSPCLEKANRGKWER